MDRERAKEILNSYGVTTVLYKGEPIWIEQIVNGDTAQIHYIQNNRLADVPLNMLIEE